MPSSRSPLHDVVIVGAYNTRQARVLDQPELEVLWDAVHGALASAGLPLSAVDGVNVTSSVRRLNAREAVMVEREASLFERKSILDEQEASLVERKLYMDSQVITKLEEIHEYVKNLPDHA